MKPCPPDWLEAVEVDAGELAEKAVLVVFDFEESLFRSPIACSWHISNCVWVGESVIGGCKN
jgi:hypothetical protein